MLRVVRSSARRSRTQAINQMRSFISTAPESLRADLRDLSIYQVLTVASACRHYAKTDAASVTKLTLRRSLQLGARGRTQDGDTSGLWRQARRLSSGEGVFRLETRLDR